MKKSVFSQWFVVLLLFSALAWWASVVGIREAAAMGRNASAGDPTTVDTIKQLEQDYGNAIQAADTDKLNQILADDWTNLGQTGELLTKQNFLSDLKSGKYKLVSFQIGPMYVKVLGNVAVVQGSVSETSIADGKESTHKSVWMDVFEKRGDKWMVVRSQTARMK